MRGALGLAWLAASAALIAAPAGAAEYHFVRVALIHLDGGTGHGDITTFDTSNHMLYLSAPGQGLNVVDTRKNETVAYIEDDVHSPNGSDWDGNYVYVCAGDGMPPWGVDSNFPILNGLAVIEKGTWREVGFVETQGTTPDWVQVDRTRHRLYVDSDDRNWMEVYDTSDPAHPRYLTRWTLKPVNSNHWMGRISDTLGDTADFTGPDVATVVPSRHEIFQSVDSYVEAIDTNTGAIERIVDTGVKLTAKGGTKGEVYDMKNNRLWVGTTDHKVFVINPDTLQIIKTLPQKAGVDVAAIDQGLGLVYTFEGSAKGFDVYDANTMEHVTFVSTGVGQTHTGDVDPETHRVYAYGGDDRVVEVFQPER